MNQAPIRLGPLALLLTVISICLTTLAILTFSTSQADRRLAQKYADTVTARYELMNRGEDFRKEAQDAQKKGHKLSSLPDTTTDEDGVTWYEAEENGMKLTVGIVPGEKSPEVVSCRVTKEWTEDLDLGNLWPGLPGF